MIKLSNIAGISNTKFTDFFALNIFFVSTGIIFNIQKLFLSIEIELLVVQDSPITNNNRYSIIVNEFIDDNKINEEKLNLACEMMNTYYPGVDGISNIFYAI